MSTYVGSYEIDRKRELETKVIEKKIENHISFAIKFTRTYSRNHTNYVLIHILQQKCHKFMKLNIFCKRYSVPFYSQRKVKMKLLMKIHYI